MKKEKSCGAIIFNDNKVLLIKSKRGEYGFPKGHVENNETEIETAIRETKEETNLDIIINENKRYTINYNVKGNIPKEVVYFIAEPKGNINLLPQEEEVDEVCWVEINKVRELIPFENLKELWDKVLIEK